jgi:FtsP/CotA-like multicopper oxidase with cupredoxin domain
VPAVRTTTLWRIAAILLLSAASVVALPNAYRAGAQSAAPSHAAVPDFASAPRFAPVIGRPAYLLGASQRTGTCNPSETVDGNNVRLDLHLKRITTSINDPSSRQQRQRLTLRTYSGCLTSPQIDVRPGNSLRINLYNDLSKNDPSCPAPKPPGLQPPTYLPPGVGCFNTTNLHTHGLHVDPYGKFVGGKFIASDDVLVAVGPQTMQPYQIDIPSDHPAGTFWYHAHMHGSTAVHVASAVAGPLIIHGSRRYPNPLADIDTILHDRQNEPLVDETFVLQQIAYGCFQDATYTNLITTQGLFNNANMSQPAPPTPAPGQSPAPYPPLAPWVCPSPAIYPHQTDGVVENFNLQTLSASIWYTSGRFTSINGQIQPRIPARTARRIVPGQVMRWRFIHAGIHDTINLQIVKMARAFWGPDGSSIGLADVLAGKTRHDQMSTVERACAANSATLVPQMEIAVDGLTRTSIHTINAPGVQPLPIATAPPIYGSNYLQPGGRSDVLVTFPESGYYCLVDQNAPASERINTRTLGGGGQGPSVPQLLGYVYVSPGAAVSGDLPGYVERQVAGANPQLPDRVRTALAHGDITPWAAFKTDLPRPPPHREPYVHFQIGDYSFGYTINGKSYDPSTVAPLFTRQLGSIDDWKLDVAVQVAPTPTPAPAGQSPPPQNVPVLDLGEPHIFHIHVNPFQIVDVRRRYYDPVSGSLLRTVSIYDKNGRCIPSVVAADPDHLADQYCGQYHVYRDTLIVENSFEVIVRTKYVRYTGEFVMHCHILDHEDAGMMLNVLVARDVRRHPKPPPQPSAMPIMRMRH